MNVVTVSREYGAGGHEFARRLADALGWELLDRELLHEAAAVERVSDAELERLDEKAIPLKDRLRLHPPHQRYIHGLTEAARQAAVRGNIVLVGRGTAQLIADSPNVLHLRLVAPGEWRARRMAQREGWSVEHALARCAEEDRTRHRFLRYFFGDIPFQPARYALVINTGRVALDHAVAAVLALMRGDWTNGADLNSAPPSADVSNPSRRVLTLARELGAGDTGFARTLGERLGLRVYDRELLEQEATRLGVTQEQLERVDEQPASIFQRFRSGSLPHRYHQVLEQLMSELAARADVLLVGRAGSRFLRDLPQAFHIRLVAPMEIRLRRVMEHRWLRESPARQLIAKSDSQRQAFYATYFGADWSDPVEYHLTLNSGRLGPAAVDVAAFAAELHWGAERHG